MNFIYTLLAGAVVVASASTAQAQLATLQSVPAEFLAGAQVSRTSAGTLIRPAVSLAKAEDAGVRVHTNTRVLVLDSNGTVQPAGVGPAAGLPPSSGYVYNTPASLACIYGLVAATNGCVPDKVTTHAAGGSKAIAIVDAYHYPHAFADLTSYSKQFGLPVPTATSFKQINLAGTTTSDGWGMEAALDVQMAHAMAPAAKIILVEAKSNAYVDMYAAVDRAKTELLAIGGGQVSQSWGSYEWSSEVADWDGHYKGTNVVYFASTGDDAYPSWPAVSANVVAVGGTTIPRNPTTFGFLGEDSWVDAGAGFSAYVPRPSYQPSTIGTNRGIPDISAVGNPYTGVWVYFTYASSTTGGWYVFGGTSVSAPLIAAIVNNSGHLKASSAAENAFIYAEKAANAVNFRVSRAGDCGTYFSYKVGTAWNPCTGVGTPKNRLHQ